MANTYTIETGTGVSEVFDIHWDSQLGILDESHVYVYTGDDYTENNVPFTWVNDTQIECSVDGEFTIRRIVPRGELVFSYIDGAVFDGDTLDSSMKQSLMIQEEVADGFATVTGSLDMHGDLDMLGYTIQNLTDPEDAGDATSKSYVDAKLATQVDEANAAVVAAEAAQEKAELSADAAATVADYVGSWDSAVGAAVKGSAYSHNDNIWQLLIDVDDITTTEPSSLNTDWFLTVNGMVVTANSEAIAVNADAIIVNADANAVNSTAITELETLTTEHTETLSELETTLGSKIAPNMVKASQCVVPDQEDGNPLPVNGSNTTYSGSSHIGFEWKYYRSGGDSIRANKDTLGNVKFPDWKDGGTISGVVDTNLFNDTEGLVSKAVYIDDNGDLQDVPVYFNYETKRWIVKFEDMPTGKLFAVSVSQEEGDIEILAEQTIIDNVLGSVSDGFEILEYGEYGNNASGTIPQGYKWSDFSRIEIYSTSNIAPIQVGSVTVISKGHLAANSASWRAFVNLSVGAYVRIDADSSTGWSISSGGSNDGGVVSGMKGWF